MMEHEARAALQAELERLTSIPGVPVGVTHEVGDGGEILRIVFPSGGTFIVMGPRLALDWNEE